MSEGTLKLTVMIYCFLNQACLPQESPKLFIAFFHYFHLEGQRFGRSTGKRVFTECLLVKYHKKTPKLNYCFLEERGQRSYQRPLDKDLVLGHSSRTRNVLGLFPLCVRLKTRVSIYVLYISNT